MKEVKQVSKRPKCFYCDQPSVFEIGDSRSFPGGRNMCMQHAEEWFLDYPQRMVQKKEKKSANTQPS